MLSTLKSRLKVSLISLILIFSLTEVSQAHRHHAYSHDGGRRADNPNWMSVLPDSIRLSELSIPGTHDTMSFFGTDHAKTQSMALNFQLESGIRVLDIRCRHVGDRFAIVHGRVHQNAWFNQVLDTVVAFLKNRRETVLMRVKWEGKDENNTRTFEETFRLEYWDKYVANMWQWTSDNPTLGEMRGKIVILQDFDRENCKTKPEPKFGICYVDSFKIQDEYKLDGNADLYNKWLKVKKHLEEANNLSAPGNRDIKYVNYLSGSTNNDNHQNLGLPFPYFVVSGHSNPATGAPRWSTGFVATRNRNLWPDFPRLISADLGARYIFYEGTNTLTYGAIRTGYYTKRVGIIMTDFPGGGLIERIICLNYPKTDPLCKRLPPCTGRMCT